MSWRGRSAHKFTTERVEIDGIKFASKAEARRYQDLKLLERAGEISHLNVHPRYPIVVNEVKICTVVLDFSFQDKARGFVLEDVKSERIGRDGKVKYSTDTRISKIGRKLIKAVYGIEVEVVK